MSVGSAFDAYVKSHIYKRLRGEDAKYEFQALFEAQVEAQHRDFALEAGRRCFEQYKEGGALASLLVELRTSISGVDFEFEVSALVGKDVGLPLLGRPDIFFFSPSGIRVIYDWKVNGYLSKTSPAKGYMRLWEDGKMKPYKEVMPVSIGGIEINSLYPLESVDTGWADQLCTYGWILGQNVGSSFVIGIEQLACNSEKVPVQIRTAQHRSIVTTNYQIELYGRYVRLFQAIQSGWVLRSLPEDVARARQELLDKGTSAQPALIDGPKPEHLRDVLN